MQKKLAEAGGLENIPVGDSNFTISPGKIFQQARFTAACFSKADIEQIGLENIREKIDVLSSTIADAIGYRIERQLVAKIFADVFHGELNSFSSRVSIQQISDKGITRFILGDSKDLSNDPWNLKGGSSRDVRIYLGEANLKDKAENRIDVEVSHISLPLILATHPGDFLRSPMLFIYF